MTRSTRTRARTLAAALGLSLLATPIAACGVGSVIDPAAITINGWSMSRKAFLADVRTIESDPTTRQFFAGSSSSAGADATPDTGVINPVSAAAVLDVVVTTRLIVDEAARRGITVLPEDDARIAEAAQSAATQQGGSGGDLAALAAAVDKLGTTVGPTVKDGLAAYFALQRVLTANVDVDAEARALFENARAQLDELCVTVILFNYAPQGDPTGDPGVTSGIPVPGSAEDLATKKRAEDAKARAEAGEDFAELAKTLNEDEQFKEQGGVVPCGPTQGQEPLVTWADLPVGTITEPTETGQGYAVAEITDKKPANYEDYRTEAETAARQQSGDRVAGEALDGVAGRATVVVDPMFGSWSSRTGRIRPPDGAAPAPTIAVVPSSVPSPFTPSEALPGAPVAEPTTAQGDTTATTSGSEPDATATEGTSVPGDEGDPPATGRPSGSTPGSTPGTATGP